MSARRKSPRRDDRLEFVVCDHEGAVVYREPATLAGIDAAIAEAHGRRSTSGLVVEGDRLGRVSLDCPQDATRGSVERYLRRLGVVE